MLSFVEISSSIIFEELFPILIFDCVNRKVDLAQLTFEKTFPVVFFYNIFVFFLFCYLIFFSHFPLLNIWNTIYKYDYNKLISFNHLRPNIFLKRFEISYGYIFNESLHMSTSFLVCWCHFGCVFNNLSLFFLRCRVIRIFLLGLYILRFSIQRGTLNCIFIWIPRIGKRSLKKCFE